MQLSSMFVASEYTTLTATLRESGLPVYRYDESTQRGDTFGHRLCNAIEDTLSLGHGQVIIVGGDCPTLRTSDITTAAQLLQSHGSVLGPDERGGIYLIALTATTYNREALLAVRWQTADVRRDIQKHLDDSPPALLTTRRDVHSLDDIRDLLHEPRELAAKISTLVHYILDQIRAKPRAVTEMIGNPCIFLDASQERGPPVLV